MNVCKLVIILREATASMITWSCFHVSFINEYMYVFVSVGRPGNVMKRGLDEFMFTPEGIVIK